MYMITHAEKVVPIPPNRLSENFDEVVVELAKKQFEGQLGSDKSITILIMNVTPKGPGRIVHGDGSVYQTVEFDQVVFKFKENELVVGNVVSIKDFGVFVKFGPLDGLIYIKELMEDRVDVDIENQRMVGRENGKAIGKDDNVRARIISFSLNENNPQDSRIGLVTRGGVGLGRLDWIEEDEKKRSVA